MLISAAPIFLEATLLRTVRDARDKLGVNQRGCQGHIFTHTRSRVSLNSGAAAHCSRSASRCHRLCSLASPKTPCHGCPRRRSLGSESPSTSSCLPHTREGGHSASIQSIRGSHEPWHPSERLKRTRMRGCCLRAPFWIQDVTLSAYIMVDGVVSESHSVKLHVLNAFP